MSVGYDMYLKLLEEAVLEEQGEAPAKRRRVHRRSVGGRLHPGPIRPLPGAAHGPVPPHRRASARSEDADDMTDELIDRFGDPPRTVNNLISVALLRGRAADCAISDISQKGMSILFTLDEFDLEHISQAAGLFPGRVLFSPGDKAVLTLKLKKGEDPLRMASKLVESYQALIPPEAAKSPGPEGGGGKD